jgi:hypothetical protein
MKSIFSNLNEEEKAWKQTVDDVLKSELEPHVEGIEKGKEDIVNVVKALGKHGFCGVTFPQKYGGLGLTQKHELMLSEAICSYSLPVDMSRLSGSYPALLARMFGKTRDLKDYVEALVTGEKIGAFCFTEPEAGSDLTRMSTIAERDPESGDFILTGEKRFITNGSVANILIVYARNGAFIIESNWDGFEVIEEYSMMGLHGLHLGHLKFSQIHVPAKNALFFTEIKKDSPQVKAGKTPAISSMQDILVPERIALSVQALGVAKTALQAAIEYSVQRVQFNRPIAEFEGVSFKIAEMATKYEAARALVERSVQTMGNGTRAAMAKLFACQSAFEICDDAVSVLGGIGYTTKYPVERCLRDVRLLRIGGGTDEIMKYIIQKGVYKGDLDNEDKPSEATRSLFV